MSYANVNDFVARLEQNTPGSNKNFEKQRRLEKIYLNVPANFGRYQVLPLPSLITGFPYVELPNTREINLPRKNVKPDGTETIYSAWIKILPMSAYTVRDESGREVSSLTANDEKLLQQAYSIHEELWKELDAKNNAMDPTIGKLIRKKNYTLFHAHCVNRWALDNMRSPERQNFDALFVITSKKFQEALKNDISQFGMLNGLGDDWLNQVYNRDLTGRQGFLMFTVQRDPTRPGFSFTANHAVGKGDYLKSVEIKQEDMDLMGDPIETFLGWQCGKNAEEVPVGQKRLFNENLITQAINFMTQQLAKIRMAKQSGGDVAAAIAATNEEALKAQAPTDTMGQTTNDPMLAEMANRAAEANMNQNVAVNPQTIAERNTDPFATPPAAHIDPITGSPVGSGFGSQQSAPFSTPSFANPGFGSGNNDLPF
jgi:hypothetical protein